MQKKGYFIIAIGILLCVCIFNVDYAYSFFRYDGTYKGKVIDADTREPIEGVVVLGVWSREYPTAAGAVHKFYDARETVTDKNGEFEIPGVGLVLWLWPLPGIIPMDVLIFKAGYTPLDVPWSWVKKSVKFEDNKAIIRLKKLTMEQRRQKGLPTRPSSVPVEKMKLLTNEIDREEKEIYGTIGR